MMLQPPTSAMASVDAQRMPSPIALALTLALSRDSSAWHGNGLEHLLDHGRGLNVADAGGRIEDDAVPQHWLRQHFDVVWDDVVTAAEERDGLRSSKQSNRPARACSQVNVRVVARRGDDVDDIATQRRVHLDPPHCLMCLDQLVR